VQTNAATLTVEKDGSFDLRLNVREAENNADPVLSDDLLIARARELTKQLSFVGGQNLRVGMVRDLNENAGTAGSIGEARVAEKTIIFDQTINGLSFIDPKAGHLEITFGARSGQVKRVRNTLKPIQAAPTGNATAQTQVMSQQEARQQAIAEFNKTASNTNGKTSSAEIVEGSEDVGYQMIDGKAVLVYRALLKSSADSSLRPFLAVIPLQK
jgi:hypothetical protein